MQKPEHSEEEEPENREQASPEEQQQTEPTQTESGDAGTGQESATPRKRRRKGPPQLTEAELSQQSHKSIWPILLALAVAVLIAGAITYPIVLGIGLVCVIVSIIGWSLERQ